MEQRAGDEDRRNPDGQPGEDRPDRRRRRRRAQFASDGAGGPPEGLPEAIREEGRALREEGSDGRRRLEHDGSRDGRTAEQTVG